MKQLSVDINKKNFDNVDMSILSMGMTNDYEIAVEEGDNGKSWNGNLWREKL